MIGAEFWCFLLLRSKHRCSMTTAFAIIVFFRRSRRPRRPCLHLLFFCGRCFLLTHLHSAAQTSSAGPLLLLWCVFTHPLTRFIFLFFMHPSIKKKFHVGKRSAQQPDRVFFTPLHRKPLTKNVFPLFFHVFPTIPKKNKRHSFSQSLPSISKSPSPLRRPFSISSQKKSSLSVI